MKMLIGGSLLLLVVMLTGYVYGQSVGRSTEEKWWLDRGFYRVTRPVRVEPLEAGLRIRLRGLDSQMTYTMPEDRVGTIVEVSRDGDNWHEAELFVQELR